MTEAELNSIKAQIANFEKDIQIDGLSDWVEELKKENEELKTQFMKMQNCANCNNGDFRNCPASNSCRHCHNLSEWKLKETV